MHLPIPAVLRLGAKRWALTQGSEAVPRGDQTGLGIPDFLPCVRALVAEEDDPVAEGPGLDELEIDLGV